MTDRFAISRYEFSCEEEARLNKLIHEHIFNVSLSEHKGWVDDEVNDIPCYCTNLNSAQRVWEKLIELTIDGQPRMNILYTYKKKWSANFVYSVGEYGSSEFEDHLILASSDTMEHVICLVAEEYLSRKGIK
jgi:hypothetical protein